MNGLEEKYRDVIEFRALDANSSGGQKAFSAFHLPGHPSFVLLNPAGQILWTGFGQQGEDLLILELERVLATE